LPCQKLMFALLKLHLATDTNEYALNFKGYSELKIGFRVVKIALKYNPKGLTQPKNRI